MRKFLLLALLCVLFASCQKSQSLLTPPSSEQMKTANSASYNKTKNAISKRVEFESYCTTDYQYTETIFIDGVECVYPSSGYEYLMYKGLTHFTDASNDYYFAALEYPLDGYAYGIGFGNHFTSSGYYPFTANVKVCIPEKNYSITYSSAPCFAIGNQDFTHTDSIRFVLHKKQSQDVSITPDSTITFEVLKLKLGTGKNQPDSVALYSSLGKVASYQTAYIYNWNYYNAGTTDMYGLENAGSLTDNLNFGDALTGDCSGLIDIYLHQGKIIYKCSTRYSIFYNTYLGARKQLHIYQ